ncbi:MAG: hypothetical protein AAGA03_07865 [Planctomycetota bacterium]
MSFPEFEPSNDAQESIDDGRSTLLSASIGVLSITLFTIIQYNLVFGPVKLPTQIMRLFLTFWLCRSVYNGSALGRRIALVLLSVAALSFAALLFLMPELQWLTRVSLIGNVASYAYYLYAITLSNDVKAFLRSQRAMASTATDT